MGIAHSGIEPHRHPQRLCGTLGLRGARGGITARSHFALREIKNPHAMTGLYSLGERAAAGELHVIAVRGNRQQVDRLTVRPSDRHSYRSASTGSSFAARAAGAIPNTRPTRIEATVAIAAGTRGIVVLNARSHFSSSPTPTPRAMPMMPP